MENVGINAGYSNSRRCKAESFRGYDEIEKQYVGVWKGMLLDYRGKTCRIVKRNKNKKASLPRLL